MRDSLDKAKQDFDGWLEKWDDALQKGIFGDSLKVPSTSANTSDESFFGLRQDNPTDSIDPADSAYWSAINSVADGGVEMQRLDEADMGVAPLASPGPNPVRRETEGKDQEMEPRQLGLTFTEKEIEELDGMKKKLHELECRAAEMGENDYGSQIKAMIKKIDDLSDKLGRVK